MADRKAFLCPIVRLSSSEIDDFMDVLLFVPDVELAVLEEGVIIRTNTISATLTATAHPHP